MNIPTLIATSVNAGSKITVLGTPPVLWGGVVQLGMGAGSMTWTVQEATKAIGVYPDCMHELREWLLLGKRVFVQATSLDPFPKRFSKTLLSAADTIGRKGLEPVPFAACVVTDTDRRMYGIADVVRRNTFWVEEVGEVDPVSAIPLDLPPRAYGLSVSAQQAFFLTHRSILAARIACLIHITGDDPENPLIPGATFEAGYELFLEHLTTAIETLDRARIPARLLTEGKK